MRFQNSCIQIDLFLRYVSKFTTKGDFPGPWRQCLPNPGFQSQAFYCLEFETNLEQWMNLKYQGQCVISRKSKILENLEFFWRILKCWSFSKCRLAPKFIWGAELVGFRFIKKTSNSAPQGLPVQCDLFRVYFEIPK